MPGPKQIGSLYGLPIYATDNLPECEIRMERETVRVPLGNFRFVDGALQCTVASESQEYEVTIHAAKGAG